MVGQKKLLNKLNKYTLDNLPHSILFLGERGSGKHSLASFLSSKFNLGLIDMTKTIEEEYINNIYISTVPTFYLIDLTEVVEKEQNKLLKLVEEPPSNAFLILLGIEKGLILNTILSRCLILELEEYSEEELQSFSSTPLDFNLFKTPGQIINFNFMTLDKVKEVTSRLIKVEEDYPTFLNIADTINYKDEYDKIDLNILLNSLTRTLKDKYIKDKLIKYLSYYIITLELKKNLINPKFNKKYLVENYLIQLWKESNNDFKRIKN